MKRTFRLLVFFVVVIGIWQAIAASGIWRVTFFRLPEPPRSRCDRASWIGRSLLELGSA